MKTQNEQRVFVDVKIPVKEYEVYEMLAEREGKTVEDFIVELTKEYCARTSVQFKEDLEHLDRRAKKQGLTVPQYLDKVFDALHEKLKQGTF